MRNLLRPFLISIASISLVLTACGGEEASVADGPATIVVTTNILGDVVAVSYTHLTLPPTPYV